MSAENRITTFNPSGKMVVLYGMNNLGKTTQAKRLVACLNESLYPAIYLKYPIYDLEPTGPKINDYLRAGKYKNKTPYEIQEWYTQNRRDFEPTLKKYLESGLTVVAEDYLGTGLSWGCINGARWNDLLRLNSGLYPADLEILFDGNRFPTGHEVGHAHEDQDELHWTLGRYVHLAWGKELGWKTINANGSEDEISRRIWREVEMAFSESRERRI